MVAVSSQKGDFHMEDCQAEEGVVVLGSSWVTRKGTVMLCIVYALAQLGLMGAVMVAAYPVGWALGDLYEKRKEARAARAAIGAPTTVGV